MKKVLIFFTGVFGFILLFSVSAIISYFMYPETQETTASSDSNTAAVKMDFGGDEVVSGSSELTIVTPALDKTKTIVSHGSMNDALEENEEYSEEDTYYEDTYAESDEDGDTPVAKSENTQSAPKTTIVEQAAADSAAEVAPEEVQEEEIEWGIEIPPNTTVVTPDVDSSVQLSDTGL